MPYTGADWTYGLKFWVIALSGLDSMTSGADAAACTVAAGLECAVEALGRTSVVRIAAVDAAATAAAVARRLNRDGALVFGSMT
jgi:hypothetical protein